MRPNNSKFIIHNSTLLLFLSLLLVTSCDTTNPPSNNKITLTFEDASCTEAWLNLKLDNITLPTKITIKQDDSTIVETNINSTDTTLFIEHLLPSQNYTFYSTIKQMNNEAIKSNNLSITTMDTTSHNFTWQTFTFGNRNSVLKDVAIINKNNIWAVGEIHTAETDQWNEDSTKWVQPYNAVHWDGNTWELKRILVNYKGNTIFLALESIFAFSATDIWLVSSLPIHGDGKNWKIYDVREETNSNLSLTTVWGSSSNDIYFAGRSGSLAHYNGSSWTKIESGTELSINDIWGDYNEKMGKWEVLAVASSIAINEGNKLISINNHTSTPLSTEGLRWAIQTIWFKTKRKYLIGGDGLFQTNSLLNTWETNKLVPNIWTVSLNGIDINDLFSTGPFGMVLHYNGITWRDYTNETKYKGVCYATTSINNNLVAISGATSDQGVILIGRR